MEKRMLITLSTVILIAVAGTYAHGDLRTLIRLGKSQADMSKASKKETRNYNRVKDAITASKLKEGMSADKIRKKYGEPIFDNIYDKKRNAYKWLYMPATSTHFGGEKVYLFVGEDGKLVGWKLVEPIEEEG